MNALTCNQMADLFSQIIDAEPLNDRIREHFKDHLAGCNLCRENFNDWTAMEKLILRILQTKKDKHIATARLAKFADDACKNEFERLLIEDHLSKCSECRSAFEDILLLNQSAAQFDFNLPLSWKIRKKVQKWTKKYDKFGHFASPRLGKNSI